MSAEYAAGLAPPAQTHDQATTLFRRPFAPGAIGFRAMSKVAWGNDPYGGATHSPDVAIVIPIFFDGELVGFSGASAHVLDIGGAYPGLAIDLVDNWSEGNIYRAVKLQDKGVWQAGLWKHILDNVRTPSFNNGDIQAMIAACELAKRRYVELLSRYGQETVLGVAQAWLDYSEQMLRSEIVKVPDGRYETEWRGLHRPSGMHLPYGKCPVCYVGEIGPYYEFNRGAPNLGPRVSILGNDGRLLARIGVEPAAGEGPGQFYSPHGLAVDSRGDLYVGEVSYTAWPNLFPSVPVPKVVRTLQKFERVAAVV